MKRLNVHIFLLLVSPVALLADDLTIRVAVFDEEGVGPSSEQLITSLEECEGSESRDLEDYPGGDSRWQARRS